MKSTPMTLVSMDAADNTDIIFNQPSQKVPLDKKRPTYLHAVIPPQVLKTVTRCDVQFEFKRDELQEIDDEYQLKNKVYGEKIMVNP